MAYSAEDKRDIQDKILEYMIEGNSPVREAIKAVGISTSTFYDWLENNEVFAKRYARACDICIENMADEILEIADDSRMDFQENEEGVPVFNREHVQRSNLRIDARKWLMSKRMPKKYGNRIEIENQNKLSDPNSMTIEEQEERLKELLSKATVVADSEKQTKKNKKK